VPADDSTVESSETVALTLNAGTGYSVGTASASGTIADNDGIALPTLAIGPASITEGNNGKKTVAVTVTLSAASTSTVTVNYATVAGTATAGTDFQSTSGTLSFAAGVTSRTINVTVNGDKVKESNETFSVVLSNASGATIGTGSATVTIVDDENALTAAESAPQTLESTATISEADVARLAAEAMRRWSLVLDQASIATLRGVKIEIADLPDQELGRYEDGVITVDVNAAGWGWFVDRTARDDQEFVTQSDGTLHALQQSDAYHRMDLLTVISHEIGHGLGYDHTPDDGGHADLMASTLAAGVRETPSAAEISYFDSDAGLFIKDGEKKAPEVESDRPDDILFVVDQFKTDTRGALYELRDADKEDNADHSTVVGADENESLGAKLKKLTARLYGKGNKH
jgi:hypothetical protein